MKRYCIILEESDIDLIRTLLFKHRDYTISKRRLYEICNGDGSYNHILTEYKKLVSRYSRLLSIIKVER